MYLTPRSLCSLLLAFPLLGSCARVPSAPSGPEGTLARTPDSGSITIIRLAPDHPPFVSTSVSFWAKAGTDREAALYFEESPGKRGQSYARFRVRKESLLAYPDGRPFARGDSVRITMSIVDPDFILLEMQPSGLQFDPARPAELKIEYDHADPDYNRDGNVDADDAAIQQSLAVWTQEEEGGPFLHTFSVNFERQREIFARILSFSRLAVAY